MPFLFWENTLRILQMLDDVRQHAGNHDVAPAAVQSKPSAQYATEKLVGKYRGSCRNVTADNCFTWVALVKNVPEIYDLTYVRTDRKNKREIPYKMLNKGDYSSR